MSILLLPAEITSSIIAQLDGDKVALEHCALVHRTWLPHCRAYLHSHILVRMENPGYMRRLMARYYKPPLRDFVRAISLIAPLSLAIHDLNRHLQVFYSNLPLILSHFSPGPIRTVHCQVFMDYKMVPPRPIVSPYQASTSRILELDATDVHISLIADDFLSFITSMHGLTHLSLVGAISLIEPLVGARLNPDAAVPCLSQLKLLFRKGAGRICRDIILEWLSTSSQLRLTSVELDGLCTNIMSSFLAKCGESLKVLRLRNLWFEDDSTALLDLHALRALQILSATIFNSRNFERIITPLSCTSFQQLHELSLTFTLSSLFSFLRWKWETLDNNLAMNCPSFRKLQLCVTPVHYWEDGVVVLVDEPVIRHAIEQCIASHLPQMVARSLLQLLLQP